MFLRQKIKLPTTQEGMDLLVDSFLSGNNFPVDEEHRALFGMFIQQSDANEDFFEPKLLASQMRKALSIRCAFYLIHPSKRPKKEEASNEAKVEGV